SPDGRWIAFDSNESGRPEVYVASVPSLAERRLVSSAGGLQPIWRNDGKELFYLAPDGKLTAVDVKPGSTLEAGTAKPLFQTGIGSPNPFVRQYATGDGKKFLVIEPIEKSVEQLNVVLNWTAGLR